MELSKEGERDGVDVTLIQSNLAPIGDAGIWL